MREDRPCLRCGHPESHHDAGECWTTVDGRETYGETACPCSWAEFDEVHICGDVS